MQSECAILFVGETWMRPLRVHPFEGSVHEVFSVITPFVQVAADEGRSKVCQKLAPGFACFSSRSVLWINERGNLIE